MQTANASRTAVMTALGRGLHRYRAAPPWVLDDPFGVPLAGPGWEQLETSLRAVFSEALMDRAMAAIVARSRVAEDRLLGGRATQYVHLGAGLDAFAWRRPDALTRLRVFEVDHPATQAAKRERVAALGLPVPDALTFVPVDFESQDLATELRAAGFDPAAATCFAWLGVIPYLTEDAILEVLRFVASCAPGSELVFSYAVTDGEMDDDALEWKQRFSEIAAASGEPVHTFLAPGDVARLLTDAGLELVECATWQDLRERYVAGRDDLAPPYALEAVVTARVPASPA